VPEGGRPIAQAHAIRRSRGHSTERGRADAVLPPG
jgi:hypothetical protein